MHSKPDEFAAHARRQVLNHARKQWNKSLAKTPPLKDDPSALVTGEEQLFSSYQPGLVAGRHIVTVEQDLATSSLEKAGIRGQSLTKNSTKIFNVVAPQYSLPQGSVHTMYPPQGHADEARILPHVLLEDPLLPWEREATKESAASDALNIIPWLALFVFEPDELRIDPKLLPAGAQPQTKTTMTVKMQFGALNSINTVATTPVDVKTPSTQSQDADFIFIQAAQFQTLFSCYNTDGSLIPIDPKNPVAPDLTRYKYLAHARHVNMAGMASAAGEDDVGLFSVVMAHRTGRWDSPVSTTMIAHLVSIERVADEMMLPVSTPYVAMCSLYSWTYTVLPAGSFNLFEAMEHIGTTRDVLRAPLRSWNDFISGPDPVLQRVGQRMQDGYTVVRQRAQTGELTAALVRGPFVPTNVPCPLSKTWNRQSTFATDLQILDKNLGLMDISYSMAWQLGKTLAIADMSFASALGRLRSLLHATGMKRATQDVLAPENAKFGIGAKDLLGSIPGSIKTLTELPQKVVASGGGEKNAASFESRWRREKKPPVDLNFWSKEIRERYKGHVVDVAHELAGSLQDRPDGKGKMLFNEHNQAVNTDWALVLQWVLDRMHFTGIPANYLIPDTSYLPKESLRFFAIDSNWNDALLDGALSIANHLEGDEDYGRLAIKSAINTYISTPDPVLGYAPLIPTFGLLFRSEVIKKFPDIRIDAPRKLTTPPNPRPPLLRHELLAEDTMIVLFDRHPNLDEFHSITFSQPPHQQRFAAAENVGQDTNASNRIVFDMLHKDAYTSTSKWPTKPVVTVPPAADPKEIYFEDSTPPQSPIFDFVHRCLIFPNFATDVHTYLKDNMHLPNGTYDEVEPSAALMGIQLNDPLLQMEIGFPPELLMAMGKNEGRGKVRTLKLLQPRNRFGTADKVQAWRDAVEAQKQAGKRKILLHIQATSPPHTKEHHHVKEHHHAKKHPYRNEHPDRFAPGHLAPISTSSRSIPPHYRSLRDPPPLTVPPRLNIAFDQPDPQYDVYCRAAGQTKMSTIPYAAYASDLIFTVKLPPGAPHPDWHLKHILIEIPLGTDLFAEHPPLAPAYSGPGGRMLSNLRLNPLVKSTSDNKKLHVRLFPRTTAIEGLGGITTRAAEMGFTLGEVEVNPFKQDASVIFWQSEYYNESSTSHKKVFVTVEGSERKPKPEVESGSSSAM